MWDLRPDPQSAAAGLRGPVTHRIQYDESRELSTHLVLSLAEWTPWACARMHKLMKTLEHRRRWTAYAQVVFKL